ncbi:MAG: putative DNA binding domain-containing protein [Rhodobacteraceae bacterium]|nr:putative DNA binding domain-containing protein [Paracoccaceae bacterium]
MTYDGKEIGRRLRLGEDSRWEFKQIEFAGSRPRSPSRDSLADEIAAFANASGGMLLCGVSDDGETQGMSREQLVELDTLLVELATDSINPAVRIETHHKELPTGKRILLVVIPKGDSQHDSPGGSFVRVGSSKRRMASDERFRLAQRRSQARDLWFDTQPLPDTGFGTLDEALWKPLLSAAGAAEPEAALEKLALLAPDDAGIPRATVTGVLLCTRSPERFLPGASITATCYRGRDRTSGQVDSQEITGPLNRQIADAMTFAMRNMRISARKTPARVELPQYSDKVLFEAVVNAVVHRNYSVHGSKIRLSLFEDRLEIQSPGSLPNNLTLDSMAERQATRNEALTSVLGRMPVGEIRGSGDRLYFMERRGDGVPIIRRETRELSGKVPEYRLINDSEICLVIPAAAQEESAAHAIVTAWSKGMPVPGVEILVLSPNKTWKQATTNTDGEANFDLHTTHLPMTVFAAAPFFAAHVTQAWTPGEGALAVDLWGLPKGGSVVFPEATGHLPGLRGRLNPIRDTHDRTYLYASNIAINEGQQQPVHFFPGEELRLTDADGNELWVRIVDIVGRSALVEYRASPQGDQPR